MEHAQSVARSKPPFNTIQLLRFYAAFMVVVSHASFYAQRHLDAAFQPYQLGENGVRLSLAISGFVMVVSTRKLVTTSNGWKTFLQHRVLRIVPLYWLITTFKIGTLIFAASLFSSHSNLEFGYILKSYVFIPVLDNENLYRPVVGVAWTLNLEMFFYAIFMVSLLLKLPRVKTATIVIALLVLLRPFTNRLPPVASFYCDPIMLNYIWGMAAAHLLRSTAPLNVNTALAAVIAGLAFLFFPRTVDKDSAFIFVLNNLAIFIVIYGITELERKRGTRLLRPLIFMGTASYSLYLTHTAVIAALAALLGHTAMGHPMIYLQCCALLAPLVAALVHALVERPMANQLAKLWPDPKTVPATARPPARKA